jgi:signal transduction histidine kinase/ActR/RegA family two-component response regulator
VSRQEANVLGTGHGTCPGPPADLQLSPAIRGQLLDPSLWHEGLVRYARAANFAVTLADVKGRPLGECINPQPTWARLRGRMPSESDACPFALMPLAPCTCVADALAGGSFRLLRDPIGLVHFAVPLILGNHALGALVAGQVFDQYPDQLAVEHVADQLGLAPQDVWQLARQEHPVKSATVRVYADLLAMFADHILRSRYHTLTEAAHLGEMTRLREQLRLRTQDLAREDQRKDEFLAVLAHELRNPLAPLRNGLQVMRLAHGDANGVAQARAMMERQLGHMVRLVDDLLDISRLSQNKLHLHRSRVTLSDVVGAAVETARPAIDAAEHELTVSLPPAPIFLDADLTRLAQVVGNLLTNSAKYTERGGRIWLGAESGNGAVTLSVRDSGIGIPADALPHIFDMFSQVQQSMERSSGGLGIGLALVKGLVEMHGGTIAAQSAGLGKGSAFTVKLPVLEAPTEPPREVNAPDDGQIRPNSKQRVLVVDDNHDSATSLAMILKLLGDEVITAQDGIEALEAAERFRPEVILMDVGMPRLNGLDATRRIREQPWGKALTIIALTGWGQVGDRALSRKAGCDGHLVKPVDLPDLEKLLAELSEKRNPTEPQLGPEAPGDQRSPSGVS